MEREEAIEEAWKLAIEAVSKGKVTLQSGQVVLLSDRDLVKHIQWLATVGKVRPKGFPLPKDMHVKATNARAREARENSEGKES